jgi:hypothetical protein
MPKVAELRGRIRICQFHNDHDPPHFHVQHAGQDTLITIAELRILRGTLSPRIFEQSETGRSRTGVNWR